MLIKKVLKTILTIIVAVIIIALLTILIGRGINLAKINNNIPAEGINQREYIEVNGIEEFVQIRGADKDNPVIMFLHGGPGSNSAFYSYTWELELEKDFTIVHYDQRASGNTYYKNPEAIDPSVAQLVSDLDKTVDYVRELLDKDKVIIVGHSWGSMLGALYSLEHDDKVSTFIGIGQLVDSIAISELVVGEGIKAARENGDFEHAAMTEATYQEFGESATFSVDKYFETKAAASKYLPEGETISYIKTITMGLFSPDMTASDLRWYFGGMEIVEKTNSYIYDELFVGGVSLYDEPLEYKMPVFFISGADDWVTPVLMTEEYFDSIIAPYKGLQLVEGAGHTPFLTHADAVVHLIKSSIS